MATKTRWSYLKSGQRFRCSILAVPTSSLVFPAFFAVARVRGRTTILFCILGFVLVFIIILMVFSLQLTEPMLVTIHLDNFSYPASYPGHETGSDSACSEVLMLGSTEKKNSS